MADYGDGFSVSALKYMRLLYVAYQSFCRCRVQERDRPCPVRGRQALEVPEVSHEQVTADKG
jgi:hypothetical protein